MPSNPIDQSSTTITVQSFGMKGMSLIETHQDKNALLLRVEVD